MQRVTPQDANAVISADDFAQTVVNWQRQHGRNDLPWQQHNDPYHVLVSELMLQQTQVKTVIPYFQRWLEQFPTFTALANADEQEVMACWQGLGYYRRARNLQAAAQKVVADYQGTMPQAMEELREIPGVGPYTVGAIRAFAFDAPAAIVDGNVKRLLGRLFTLPYVVNKSTHDKYFWELSEHYTPTVNNRRFAQGLLDLGATVCKPRQPTCELCPLQKVCCAYQQDCVEDYPKREVKARIPTRPGHFCLDINGQGVVLEQRPADGIWPSLWSLPECKEAPQGKPLTRFKHTFSHYKLDGHVWVTSLPPSDRPRRRIEPEHLANIGLPAPIRKLLEQLNWDEVCQIQL
ncbi:A/G-specific adenine glycosylase [Pseudidiomarina sediminum]|uniref:Adenine DNA glycosylase n=1 Tax=Pseudidiomarina sediminum TaxID=431675 RepID=A0A432Z3B3_9GAMM|nr:A/G-specific adenine glycosylase [Pseudidiomarina sediminum]MBY6064642.1 A/G-specific adenine glycosylase [Pseudidiomarina sediminum]RUO72339.1 A/G-specific adenine glycosylase [Pseudidiomarina sediminum]